MVIHKYKLKNPSDEDKSDLILLAQKEHLLMQVVLLLMHKVMYVLVTVIVPNYVALQVCATVSPNVTFTLPSADGTSGQAILTDASGNLSFAAAGATISSDTSTNTDFLLYFASTTSGALTAVKQDSGLTYNPKYRYTSK